MEQNYLEILKQYGDFEDHRSGRFVYHGLVYNVSFWPRRDVNDRIIGITPYLFGSLGLSDDEKKEAQDYFENNIDTLLGNAIQLVYISAFSTVLSDHSNDFAAFYYEEDGKLVCKDAYDFLSQFFWDSSIEVYEEKYRSVLAELEGSRGKDYIQSLYFYKRIIKEYGSIPLEEAYDILRKNPEKFRKQKGIPGYEFGDSVISISKPDISRERGNTDKNTFDFVSVEVLLRSDLGITVNTFDDYIRDNLSTINMRVCKSLDSDKRFQKYGVPASFLSLYAISKQGTVGLFLKYELRRA